MNFAPEMPFVCAESNLANPNLWLSELYLFCALFLKALYTAIVETIYWSLVKTLWTFSLAHLQVTLLRWWSQSEQMDGQFNQKCSLGIAEIDKISELKVNKSMCAAPSNLLVGWSFTIHIFLELSRVWFCCIFLRIPARRTFLRLSASKRVVPTTQVWSVNYFVYKNDGIT